MTVVHTNGYLEAYYQGCLDGTYVVGAELLTELERLMADMEGDEYIYDTREADMRMCFMEGCIRLTKSPFYGQPFRLLPFQKAFITAIYGFKMLDGHNRFQRVLLLIARKNGKSELCSALLLTDMMIGGMGRDIVCSSNNNDQADILYKACDTMRLMIDPKSLDTWRNQQHLRCKLNDNKISKMSDRTTTKEGRNIDLAAIDEIHEMKSNSIVKPIEQSQSLKENPLLILITTEGFVPGGFLDEELRRARGILRDEIDDAASRRYLPWLYTMDGEQDVWNGTRENRLWMKSNPTLGTVKKWDYLEQQVDLAKQYAAERAFVMSKDFNLKSNTSDAWLLLEDYDYEEVFDLEDFRGAVCLGAVDIAETTDLSCAKVLLMKPGDPKKYIYTQYFMPEAKLERADDRAAGAKYVEWARQGFLTIARDCNYLETSIIADWFFGLYKQYGLRPYKVFYDVKFSTEFVHRLDDYGIESELVYQSAEVLNAPTRMVESDLKSRHIIGLNEMDKWCLGNAALKVDSKGNGMVVKIEGQNARKIDGVVTTIILYEGYRRYRAEFSQMVR